MAEWTEIAGGEPVTPAQWATAATLADCRVEFPPEFDAVATGEIWVRFGHPQVAGDRDVLIRLAIDAELDAVVPRVRLRVRGPTIASFVAEPVLSLAYAEASGGKAGKDPSARCDGEVVARVLSYLAGWGETLFPNGIPDEVPFTGWDELPEDG